ncbi:hypothetical protein D3C85_1583910 [compost metagenome]
MRHWAIEQCTRQGAGGGGVADAHFTADKQLCAYRFGPLRTVATGLQSEFALSHGHRRTLYEVRRARTDVQVPHTRQTE